MKNEDNQKLADLTGREVAILAPLVVMIFAMGVVPGPFFDRLAPAANVFLRQSGVAGPQVQSVGAAPQAPPVPQAKPQTPPPKAPPVPEKKAEAPPPKKP